MADKSIRDLLVARAQDGRFRLEGLFPGLEVGVTANGPGLRYGVGARAVVPEAGKAVDVGDIRLPSGRE